MKKKNDKVKEPKEKFHGFKRAFDVPSEEAKYKEVLPQVEKFIEHYPETLYQYEFVEVRVEGRKGEYFAYREIETGELSYNDYLAEMLKYITFDKNGWIKDVNIDIFVHQYNNKGIFGVIAEYVYNPENTFKKVYAYAHKWRKKTPSTWLDSARSFVVKTEFHPHFWNLLRKLKRHGTNRELAPSETLEEMHKIVKRFCGNGTSPDTGEAKINIETKRNNRQKPDYQRSKPGRKAVLENKLKITAKEIKNVNKKCKLRKSDLAKHPDIIETIKDWQEENLKIFGKELNLGKRTVSTWLADIATHKAPGNRQKEIIPTWIKDNNK